MSTTWLIACVALYMTERLSRRSFSQSPTFPGAWRIRDPSPTGMLRKIADRSSGLARLSMSTRAVSSLPASVIVSWKIRTVWPIRTWSPVFSGTGSPTVSSLRYVPLADLRSRRWNESSTRRTSACRRETSLSWSRIGLELSRPSPTALALSSNRLPWSAPLMMNNEATPLPPWIAPRRVIPEAWRISQRRGTVNDHRPHGRCLGPGRVRRSEAKTHHIKYFSCFVIDTIIQIILDRHGSSDALLPKSPPPLWERVRVGGRSASDTEVGTWGLSPHPNAPPQGGRGPDREPPRFVSVIHGPSSPTNLRQVREKVC